MTLFFLLVGLEIRREATAGALAERRAMALPVIAAVGGVLAPAAIFLALNHGHAQGWSIPTATDVAFTLFSLEQLPETSGRALANISKRTRLGSIHLEPVAENYPMTVRGLMGRLYQWKQDYLRGFDRVAAQSGARAVHRV